MDISPLPVKTLKIPLSPTSISPSFSNFTLSYSSIILSLTKYIPLFANAFPWSDIITTLLSALICKISVSPFFFWQVNAVNISA